MQSHEFRSAPPTRSKEIQPSYRMEANLKAPKKTIHHLCLYISVLAYPSLRLKNVLNIALILFF